MLKTETHTPAMERRIRRAARVLLGGALGPAGPCGFTVYEHGQWWVTNHATGAIWSVVDAEGPDTFDGFAFEAVSYGGE